MLKKTIVCLVMVLITVSEPGTAGFNDVERKPFIHRISNEEAAELYSRAVEDHYALKEFRQARILLEKVYQRSYSDLRDDSLYFLAKTWFYENKYNRVYDYLRKLVLEFPDGNVVGDKDLAKTVRNILQAAAKETAAIKQIEVRPESFNYELYRLTEKMNYCVKMTDLVRKIYPDETGIEKDIEELLSISVPLAGDAVAARTVIATSLNAGWRRVFNEKLLAQALAKTDPAVFNYRAFIRKLGVKDMYQIETEADRLNKKFIASRKKEFKDI